MLGGRHGSDTGGNNAQPGQQSGWGQPQQPQSAPGIPANQPPMDFDDDIPFLGHGYGVCRKAIYAIS